MAEVLLTAEDDGSVSIEPMDIAVTPLGGSGTVDVTQEGLIIGIYEDAGGMGYGLFADMLKVDINAGADAGAAGASGFGSVTFAALDGRYERDTGAALISLTADDLTYDITQVNPAMKTDETQTTVNKDLDLAAEITLPEGLDLMSIQSPEAFAQAVRDGLALVAEVNQGKSESTLDQRGSAFPMKVAVGVASASTGVDLSADGAMFGSAAKGLRFVASRPMVPQEVTGLVDDLTFEFAMPVIAAQEPGDYLFQFGITNLVLAEAGWALFDPSGALPHTPADLDIDVGGTAKFDMIDLMTSSDTGQPPTTMPELLTMDIRSMGLKLAGAALSGSGVFTFDNSMVAQGGPPMPLGTASVRLEGGNALIDGLIAMGVISADDASGARMMMAMFGKSAGADVLTSDIEAKAGGSVFVNGQQIQ
jgi:hypothetical protein